MYIFQLCKNSRNVGTLPFNTVEGGGATFILKYFNVYFLKTKDPEEGMATHSSIPAWRSPWTEEPGGLQSLASRHNWSALAGMHEVQWLGLGTFTAFSQCLPYFSTVKELLFPSD